MAEGDTSVQLVTTLTAAGIKTGVDAAITATDPNAAISLALINNKTLVVVAAERA